MRVGSFGSASTKGAPPSASPPQRKGGVVVGLFVRAHALSSRTAASARTRVSLLIADGPGQRPELVVLRRFRVEQPPHEVIPAAAHHVIARTTVAVRGVRNLEQIEFLVRLD